MHPTVADEESLVAGGHKVAGLPVGSVTDLKRNRQSMFVLARLMQVLALSRQRGLQRGP
jgi:cell shape-determining protein MreC